MTKAILYKNYKDVKEWLWKNFTPKEIACKGSGEILVDYHALDCLQKFRLIVDVPFSPNSAYRSEEHNKKIGGAKNSMHRKGRAFDIPITENLSRNLIKFAAKEAGFTGIGDYNTFVHIDTGPVRYWNLRK